MTPVPPKHSSKLLSPGERVHTGKTLSLRRMKQSDAAMLYARAFGNAAFMRIYRAHDFSPDVAHVEARIGRYLEDPDHRHHHLELIIDHPRRGPLGLLTLTAWNPLAASAELQVALFNPSHSGSLAAEAVLLGFDLAFNAYGVRQLTSLVYQDAIDGHRNVGSFGFVRDETFQAALLRPGDTTEVAITRYIHPVAAFRRNARLAKMSERLIGRDITRTISLVKDVATTARARGSRRTATGPAPRTWRSRTLAGLVAGLFAAPVLANTYTVSVAGDDGTGGTANTLSWAIDQANTHAGPDVIQVNTDVTMTGVMQRLISDDLTVRNDGNARTISCGDSAFRPFFIKSGTVVIDGIDVSHCSAHGGYGSGGGAGLGGAIFVNAGNLTLMNVNLSDNAAIGGAGASGAFVGGGGMYGAGASSGGSGGGGLLASAIGDTGGAGDSQLGGGGNGDSPGNLTATGGGGGFGGGGGGAYASRNPYSKQPGVANATGGNGGFGGGGGTAGTDTGPLSIPPGFATAGSGGFGGGGGGVGSVLYSKAGTGGYGGSNAGGNGAGFGGAIFVRNGTLVLRSVTLANNQASPGSGGAGTAFGQGGAIFVCTSDLDNNPTASGAHGSCAGSIDTTDSCAVTFTNNTASTSGNDMFWSNGAGGQTTLPANVTGACNAAPTASGVAITGMALMGESLAGSHTYGDHESDPQDTSGTGSLYRFVRSTDNSLASTDDNVDASTGSTGGIDQTYTVTAADAGKHLFYCITPRATSGYLTGNESCSEATARVPAGQLAQAVPTLAEWGKLILSGLLALGTLLTLHRRRR